MSRWLELEKGDGEGLDIPVGSVIVMEELLPGKAEDYPEANSFVRFNLGVGASAQTLNTAYEELERQVLKLRPGVFVKLTNPDGTKICLLTERIVSLCGVKEEGEEGVPEGARCRISYNLDGILAQIPVKETNEQIKVLAGEKAVRQLPPSRAKRRPAPRSKSKP